MANPKSRFVMGDVMDGSREAYWLNTVVDRYNPNGHKGYFFREDHEMPLLEAAGFDVEVKRKRMKWKFHTCEEMVDFMGNLFYMKALWDDSEALADLIKTELGVRVSTIDSHPDPDSHPYTFDWELIYFICHLSG